MTIPIFSDRILALLHPLEGTGTLELLPDALFCPATQTHYPFRDQIPSLCLTNHDWPPEPPQAVHASYASMEEFGDLVTRGHADPFYHGMLKAIGYNKLILDCGCGSGVLSNYLQLNNNHVLGIDISVSALALAIEYKIRNQLTRSGFIQMDLFNLAIRDDSCDVIIAHDVLHHTHNARLACRHLVKKLRPGGIILVGVANALGKMPPWSRVTLPPITRHTMDEVLDWFAENNLEYLNCSPPILDTDGESASSLFAKTQPGTAFERLITQWSWPKGILFNMVGRKTTK